MLWSDLSDVLIVAVSAQKITATEASRSFSDARTLDFDTRVARVHASYAPHLKPAPTSFDGSGVMTSVEALLTVESGRVPGGVQVFLEQDADAGRSRSWLFMCAFITIVAAITGVQGGEPLGVLAIAIFAAMAAVMAIPTRTEEEPRKPRVILLCDKGLIVREHWGLRNFRYDELTRVFVMTIDGEPQLCLEDKAGDAHLLDYLSFRMGDALRTQLDQRIRGQ